MGSIPSDYSATQSRLRIDGNDHAGVAVRERTITDVTEGVEEFRNRHHHTVFRFDFAADLVEFSSTAHQLSGPGDRGRTVGNLSAVVARHYGDAWVGSQTLGLTDFEEVQKPIRPSGRGTTHVGVATPSPLLRNVVTEIVFSSPRDMRRAYASTNSTTMHTNEFSLPQAFQNGQLSGRR